MDTHYIIRLRGQFLGTITVKTEDTILADNLVRDEIASRLELQQLDAETCPCVAMHLITTIQPRETNQQS